MNNLESLLTKIAKNQSEQEKKPSKATYIPALAGLAAGGGLAYSGQKGVSDSRNDLLQVARTLASAEADKKSKQAFLDGLDRAYRGHVDRGTMSPELFKRYTKELDEAKALLSGSQKEVEKKLRFKKLHETSLKNAKGLRTKKMLGGLGLLGLGIGTTALLRKRRKNKQMEQEKMSHVNLNHLLTKIAEDKNKSKKKSIVVPAAAGTLALGAGAGLESMRRGKLDSSRLIPKGLVERVGNTLASKVDLEDLAKDTASPSFGLGSKVLTRDDFKKHLTNKDRAMKGLAATAAIGGGLLINKARKNRKHNKKMQQEKKSAFDQATYDENMNALKKDLKRANRKRNLGILTGRGLTRLSAAHSRTKTMKKIKDLKQSRDLALAMQKKESSAYSNLRSMAGSLPASMPAGKLPSSIAGSASGMLRGSAAKKGKMLKELKKLPK